MVEWVRAMWKNYAEVIRYLFFGVLATLLNIVLYAVFKALFGYQAANSWGNVLDNILCILFAYWTNRTWVFTSRTHGRAAWNEFTKFVGCRLFTLVVDAAIMYVGGNVIGPALVASQYLCARGVGGQVRAPGVGVVLTYALCMLLVLRSPTRSPGGGGPPAASRRKRYWIPLIKTCIRRSLL